MADERFTDVSVSLDLTEPDLQAVLSGTSDDCIQVAKMYNDIITLDNTASHYKFNDYMTTEKNYNVLDGSLKIANFTPNTDNSSDILWMSVMSGAVDEDKRKWDSTHTSTLQLDFTDAEDFIGFMLYFVGDIPKEINLKYQQIDEGDVINEYEYFKTVNSNPMILLIPGFGINRILIQPTVSYIPYRCMKIYYAQMGFDIVYQDNDIKISTLVQETNLVGDKLSLNTFTFEIIDQNNLFNYGNNERIINFFKRLTPVTPKVLLNDDLIPLGKYYIDKIESDTNLTKIVTFSILGILDTIPFNDGGIYNNTHAGTIISKIFEVAGVTSYYIDPTISDIEITGTLEPCTCRQALQKVMFVCRSIVITNDSEYQIKILPIQISKGLTITRAEKISTQVTDADYITGLELNYNTYELVDEVEEIVEQTSYTAGTHTILFSNPYKADTIEVTKTAESALITVIKRSTYYVTFATSTNSPATVTITGKKYQNSTKKITIERSYIEQGRQVNVKTFSTKLCDYFQAYNLITNLLGYYETNNMEIRIKQFSKDNSMLYRQVIQNEIPDLDNYIGMYVSRTFDLTGGFIDDAKLVGYYQSMQAFSNYANNANMGDTVDVYGGDYLLV